MSHVSDHELPMPPLPPQSPPTEARAGLVNPSVGLPFDPALFAPYSSPTAAEQKQLVNVSDDPLNGMYEQARRDRGGRTRTRGRKNRNRQGDGDAASSTTATSLTSEEPMGRDEMSDAYGVMARLGMCQLGPESEYGGVGASMHWAALHGS